MRLGSRAKTSILMAAKYLQSAEFANVVTAPAVKTDGVV
jgi:hypothetical protein